MINCFTYVFEFVVCYCGLCSFGFCMQFVFPTFQPLKSETPCFFAFIA